MQNGGEVYAKPKHHIMALERHAARSSADVISNRTLHRPVPTGAKSPARVDVVQTERHRRVLACADDAEVPTVSGGTSAPVGADDVLVPTY